MAAPQTPPPATADNATPSVSLATPSVSPVPLLTASPEPEEDKTLIMSNIAPPPATADNATASVSPATASVSRVLKRTKREVPSLVPGQTVIMPVRNGYLVDDCQNGCGKKAVRSHKSKFCSDDCKDDYHNRRRREARQKRREQLLSTMFEEADLGRFPDATI